MFDYKQKRGCIKILPVASYGMTLIMFSSLCLLTGTHTCAPFFWYSP